VSQAAEKYQFFRRLREREEMEATEGQTAQPADGVPTSRFDYRDYPPAGRLAAFRHLTGAVYEVHPLGKAEAFRAEAVGYRVGDLIFNRVALSPARFTRDHRHLSGQTGDFLILQHQYTGSELLRMERGIVRIEAGNLYLRNWSFAFDSLATEMRLDSVLVPRHRLRSAVIHEPDHPVLSWSAARADGQVLASLLSAHFRLLPRITLGEAEALTVAFLGFIDGLLGYRVGAKPDTTLRAMEQYLLVRLRQGVGVEELCREFHVSRSHVYRLFEPHGGVHAYVKRQRLEHCYADLLGADPEHTRINDVAFSWGFHDTSLFSRQFRAQFGRSPSDVLRQGFASLVRDSGPAEHAPLDSESYRDYLEWLLRAAQWGVSAEAG